MKRAVQTFLVLLAVGCALLLSATATVALAAAAGVPGWAHLAAVGVIEVVLTAGTWLWITEPELRREAVTAVLLASGVAAYAGVHAYGMFGLVGPAAAIVTTHLVARSWHLGSRRREPSPRVDQVADASTPAGTAGAAGAAGADDRTHAPVMTRPESGVVRATVSAPSESQAGGLDPADARSSSTPDQALPGADLDRSGGGADRATELIAAGAGRRRIARELGVTEHAARELLADRRNGGGS